LYRHLFCDPEDQHSETAAFAFKVTDIVVVILEHNSVQGQFDRRTKQDLEAEVADAVEETVAKRQNQALHRGT
jgi:hypothetical protein